MQAHNNPTHDSSQTLPTAKSYQSSVRPSPTGQLIPPLWWQWLQAEPVPALQCFQWETQQFALLTGSESDIHTLLLTTFVKGLEILTQGLEAVTFKHSRARFAEFLYWSHENALKFCNVFPHISVKCLRTFHKILGSMWGWEEVGSFRTWKNDLMWPETSQIFIYWNKSRKKRHRQDKNLTHKKSLKQNKYHSNIARCNWKEVNLQTREGQLCHFGATDCCNDQSPNCCQNKERFNPA